MRASLDAVADELQRCAELEGGLLVLEFTADKGAFAGVSARGTVAENVAACIRDATSALRFQPAERPETFTEEYMP
jgi:hypothetical protein